MLLRNHDPKSGLLNGTRLKVLTLGQRVIEAMILTGRNKNTRVFIPRITLTPSESALRFTLKRRQYPLKPCYAMTINKSQGQTLQHVGIFLPVPVFTHGQLYVALSRTRNFDGITMSLKDNREPHFTDNIVYRFVLDRA
ncbi:ATP-dependent DNA helicase PIF1 [Elysia marginata]|uniref:ATP-dependent DNA helicase PIF1 n=1 Tax=Elysia marginata TaxID=1093978 RepID=A0AAV4F6B2_9GAST|nr:ATP-dependent DNA helicase PIF1 [Elysia marginata]